MQLIQMIKEFLISKGIIRRTQPVAIEPMLDGITKLKLKLQNAIEANENLVIENQKINKFAIAKHKEKIERMKKELEEAINEIRIVHERGRGLVIATFNSKRTDAENTIKTAHSEAEKAVIVLDNITAITTKRLVAA